MLFTQRMHYTALHFKKVEVQRFLLFYTKICPPHFYNRTVAIVRIHSRPAPHFSPLGKKTAKMEHGKFRVQSTPLSTGKDDPDGKECGDSLTAPEVFPPQGSFLQICKHCHS